MKYYFSSWYEFSMNGYVTNSRIVRNYENDKVRKDVLRINGKYCLSHWNGVEVVYSEQVEGTEPSDTFLQLVELLQADNRLEG